MPHKANPPKAPPPAPPPQGGERYAGIAEIIRIGGIERHLTIKRTVKTTLSIMNGRKRMLFLLFFYCLCLLCYDFFEDHEREFEE